MEVFKLNTDDFGATGVRWATAQLKRDWWSKRYPVSLCRSKWHQVVFCQLYAYQCRSSVTDCCFRIVPLQHQMCHWYLSLTKDVLRLLEQAYIHCRLDYCNAVLPETLADTVIKRLLSIQNTSASLVSRARLPDGRYHSFSTPTSGPVWQRIVCKTTTTTLPLLIWTMRTSWKCPSVVLGCRHHCIHVPSIVQRSSTWHCYGPTVCRAGLTIRL